MGEGIVIISDSPREKEEAKFQRFTNWKNLLSAGQMHSPSRARARNELKRRYLHRGNLWPWTLVILLAVLLRFMMFYDISFPFQSSTSSIPVVVRPKDLIELYRRARDRLGSNSAALVIRPERDAWITHNYDVKGTMTKTEIETSRGTDESLTKTPIGQDSKDGNVLTPEDNEDVNKVGDVAESQLREIGQRIKAVKEFHGQTDDVQDMREIRTLKSGKTEKEAEWRERDDDDQRQIDTLGQILDEKQTAEVGEAEAERKDSDTSEERDADGQMTVTVKNEAKDGRTAEETEAEDKRVVKELETPVEKEEAAKERKVTTQIEIDEERKADEVMMVTMESEADEQGRAGQERESAEEQKAAQKGESDDEKEATEEREASHGKEAEEERKADEQVEVREKTGEEDKSAADKMEGDVQTNDEVQKQSQQRDVEDKNLNEEEHIANDQEKDVGVLKLDQSMEESKYIDDNNPVEENEKEEEKHEDSDTKYEENGTSHNDRTGPGESHAGHCDLFEGDWEWDPEGPLYTNATCFYMQGGQNCMSNGRPDTDYLHWKWKPRDCDLPRFDARAFLEAFKGKTIGFVGDSLARNQMQSLLCMLSQIEVPRLVYQSHDDSTVRWLYEQHQVTLAVLWSPYLLKESSEGIMGFEKGQSVLYLDVLDAEWTSVMHDFDIIVLSIGQWYFKGSIYVRQDEVVGCHYCPGFNFTEMAYQEAFQGALRQVLGKVASEFKGIAIMSTFAISHFEDGPWDKGGQCRREQPLSKEEGEKLTGLHDEMHDIVMSEYNSVAYDKSKLNEEVKLDFLDVTKVSLTRADGHPGPYRRINPYQEKGPDEWVINDCLHWCLPGPVDTWNQLLVKLVHRHLGSSS